MPAEPSFGVDELSGGNQRWVKVPKFRVVESGQTETGLEHGHSLIITCVLNFMARNRPVEMNRTIFRSILSMYVNASWS